MHHATVWHTAFPFWRASLSNGNHQRFEQPELLGFRSDGFMDQLQEMLSGDPSRLSQFIVAQESERDRGPVKLYQPVHQRYYLVAASLVCRLRGLPDRRVDVAAGESTSFVIRRVEGTHEYGYFGERGWKLLDDPQSLDLAVRGADGSLTRLLEERLPMFAVPMTAEPGSRRRLTAGFIPVGNRETYEAAVAPNSPAAAVDDPLSDARVTQFHGAVVHALRQLSDTIDAPGDACTARPPITRDEDARELFSFALLDLTTLLHEHFPQLLEAASETAIARRPALDEGDEVLQLLDETGLSPLLAGIWKQRSALLGATGERLPTDALSRLEIKRLVRKLFREGFVERVDSLIHDTKASGAAQAADRPASGDGSTYVIRSVYERPRCAPHAGPVVSRPTRPFQLASYFDPGVPMRPARISLPVDTSVAGLRRYARNVSVATSNKLREQMARVKAGFTALDDGKLNEPESFQLGELCSFSIPIVTICALILLMIIVSLLDIVFRWLPFFRICLPINLRSNE